MTLQIAKPRHRHIAMLGAPHRHNFLTLLRFAAPAAPAMPATVTSTLRPHMSYCSHHLVSRSMPTNLPHMVYLLEQHRCDLVCAHLSQSRPPAATCQYTQVGTHPVRSATTYERSARTALAGTHNPVGADPRAGTGPFPKPRALVLPIGKFGQSKPDGLGYIDTVDSDLMHHRYRLSVLQWNPGPARRNPTNIIAAACGKFHAGILREASDHVPHNSDQFIAYTGNTDLAILLNKDTFEPDPLVFAFKEDTWSYSSFEACCDALHFLEHRRLHFALCTSTMSWPRNVMLPLIFYDGHMATRSSTTSTSLAVTLT